LFELEDKNKVEAVYMHFENKHTSLCISTQVGCAMKCSFCATGAIGFKRQMTPIEMTDQVLYFLKVNYILSPNSKDGLNVDSVSFMGMGEPLMNPKIFDAIKILNDPEIFSISQRKLSVSTVGIIPAMRKLLTEYPQVD
jgi:23S rRNA (adenine-C8)-methyltransferase